ncbi:MAG TPA: hypothetical protein VI384_04385 [Candidatus Dormibacteraeota bacterium]
MSFQHGRGFRICGAVVRKFVAPSGKIAFLTLDVSAPPRSTKIEMRTFDLVEDVGCLGVGQTVEVTGSVDMEKLTSKDRNPVMVDGREKWIPALTIKKITVEGSSVRPASAATPAPAAAHEPPPARARGGAWNDEDDFPF